ncbi:hypothetical protein HCN51_32385 [Nonomuraea sp. FMUSA5-5]|uniref:SPOR domain-containing protein n=1 Tax=Nonomuraea composti TaxID=2720023 RepID=A0ABX1BE91_9ACTN|nr:hypothetical protein [Nonomuraea sp. FMUSA5-5]NJP94081.1 hypothetical protein [Nonomuraea sp. FMUSA5-5]
MGNPRHPDPRDYPGVAATLVVILVVLLPGGLAFSVHKYLKGPAPAVALHEPAPSPTPKSQDRQIDAAEFGDWNFRMDGVAFQAERVGGWTYDSCAPVDRDGLLAEYRCARAVQLAYSAYKGHLKAVQVILAFPTEKAAAATAERLAKSSRGVKWRRDKVLGTYVYGRIRSGASKRYVVYTAVTADKTAQAKAARFHQYLHADHLNYFLFREPAVTS